VSPEVVAVAQSGPGTGGERPPDRREPRTTRDGRGPEALSGEATSVRGDDIRIAAPRSPRPGGSPSLAGGATGADAASARDPAVLAVDLSLVAGDAPLLGRVSFAVRRGELVAVLGASGAGKSLLLEVLAGLTRPSAGAALVLGHAAGDPRVGPRVGYVPQADLLGEALTVREALVSTLRLRAPALAGAPDELEVRLARVLSRLGLAARAEVRIGRLSGGERRRASLAVELVADPEVLILDEVTSGLDARAERRVVSLLRGLAAAGAAVVCTTHTLESVDAFDRAVVLHGGRVAFVGTPAEVRRRFGLARIQDLYRRLAERRPGAWAESPDGGEMAIPVAPRPAETVGERRRGAGALAQLPALLGRQLRVTAREGFALAVLLGQAPLIGFLVALAYDGAHAAGRAEIGFKLALSAIWLGCVSGCQELVKERALYRRERLAGLSRAAYLASKVALVAGLAFGQAALLAALVLRLEPLGCDPRHLVAALFAAAFAAGILGLLISAAVATRTAAVGLTPVALVPQVLFVGSLAPAPGIAARIGRAMPSYWANEAVAHTVLDGRAGPPLVEMAVLGGYALLFLLAMTAVLAAREAASGGGR